MGFENNLTRPDGTADLQLVGGLAPGGHRFPPGSEVARPEPTRINLLTAIRRTLEHELATNPRMLLFGEDVGPKGGVHAATMGLQAAFGEPAVDLDKLREWKDSVVKRLTGGLAGLARQRKVKVVTGLGAFASPNHLEVTADDGSRTMVGFEQAIIACGSEPVSLPFIPHDDERVVDSTGALELGSVPERLLVVGGGIIGLEMATVYHELGSKVSVVELMDQLIPGADADIVKPLTRRITKQYEAIWLKTKVTDVQAGDDGLTVTFEGDKAPQSAVFDKVLVAVGRRPSGKLVAAEAAGVQVDESGFIPVDKQQRTNVAHIFAIGDVVGEPERVYSTFVRGYRSLPVRIPARH